MKNLTGKILVSVAVIGLIVAAFSGTAYADGPRGGGWHGDGGRDGGHGDWGHGGGCGDWGHRGDWGHGCGPAPYRGWYRPSYVYVAPPVYYPAPTYYYEPAPAYYAPAPAYYTPAPAYYTPAPAYGVAVSGFYGSRCRSNWGVGASFFYSGR